MEGTCIIEGERLACGEESAEENIADRRGLAKTEAEMRRLIGLVIGEAKGVVGVAKGLVRRCCGLSS